MGAPVFEATGRLLFADGCSAPLTRIDAPRLAHLRERLLEITAEMTQKLRAENPGRSAVAEP